MVEFVKVIVQAVLLERDKDGNIMGEQMLPPTALYTPDQISEYVENLRMEVAKANEKGVISAN